MLLIRKAFRRLHYPVDVIAQCVRWYLAYSLSLRNLEEMMAERGIEVDHSTLHRWVLRLVPLITKVATSVPSDRNGISMKRTSKSKGNGVICTARLIPPATPWIFY